MTKIENIKRLEGFRHGLGKFEVRQGRKTLYGPLNAAGEIVLEPQPKRRIHVLPENKVMLFRRHVKGDKDVILDLENNIIYSCKDYYAQKYDSTITWQRGKGYGAVGINNIIFPSEYRSIYAFVARNRKNKCGVLDSCDKELIPFEYDDLRSFHSDRFSVRQGEDWFVIDRSGQRLSEKRYDDLDTVTESGYAIFGEITEDDGWPKGKRTRYGVIDMNERIIIPAVFDNLRWFWDDGSRLSCGKTDRWHGECYVGPSWKYGVIDSRGNMIISPSYHEPLVQGPDRTYIASSIFGPFNGVIDEAGRIVVPFRDWQIRCSWRDDAYRIYDRQLERFGLYSSSGEKLLPFEFDHIDVGDALDYIAVCKGGEWYYVNQHGERVLL